MFKSESAGLRLNCRNDSKDDLSHVLLMKSKKKKKSTSGFIHKLNSPGKNTVRDSYLKKIH